MKLHFVEDELDTNQSKLLLAHTRQMATSIWMYCISSNCGQQHRTLRKRSYAATPTTDTAHTAKCKQNGVPPFDNLKDHRRHRPHPQNKPYPPIAKRSAGQWTSNLLGTSGNATATERCFYEEGRKIGFLHTKYSDDDTLLLRILILQ